MRCVVGVLTYNALSALRWGLLEQTLDSIALAFAGCPVTVLDNSSDDGSDLWVQELPRVHQHCYRSLDGNHSPGRGRNELVNWFADETERDDPEGPSACEDIVVLSDDDVLWLPGAADKIVSFWSHAPQGVALLSGLLEPEWPWNTPRETIECGGVRALVRDSAPAAAWSFPLDHWWWFGIGPLKETIDAEGEDFEACKRLLAAGHRVAQRELATHVGEGYSQLSNDQARQLAGRPLDRERWGV